MKERRERNFRILEFRENKFDIIGFIWQTSMSVRAPPFLSVIEKQSESERKKQMKAREMHFMHELRNGRFLVTKYIVEVLKKVPV